jgi:hypothetical protein
MEYAATQSVQVKDPDHPRVGEAGYTMEPHDDENGQVLVKFDSDGAEEKVASAELQIL